MSPVLTYRLASLAARVLVTTAMLYLKWKARRMAQPGIAANEVARMDADGGPEDMVLVNADGTLLLDPTADDIRTYQVPGNWPRYVCRVSTITSLLRRGTPQQAADVLNDQMARQFALENLTGPGYTGAPVPPGNAPVRIGESAVTIRDDW